MDRAPARLDAASRRWWLPLALLLAGSCVRDHSEVQVSSQQCVMCHQADYDRTATTPCTGTDCPPPHPGLFATTCGDCHNTIAWVPAVGIRHDWWPLHNEHGNFPPTGTRRCADCHASTGPLGGFVAPPTPPTCATCHAPQPIYMGGACSADGTTHPMGPGTHQHTVFPSSLDCGTCHTDGGPMWSPTAFDHSGATDCISCHSSDFDSANASMADHLGNATDVGGATKVCSTCHSTTAWTPALGHPDGCFRITSGRHAGISCATCHSEPGPSTGGQNTNCIQCHAVADNIDPHTDFLSSYQAAAASPRFCLHCHWTGTTEHDSQPAGCVQPP